MERERSDGDQCDESRSQRGSWASDSMTAMEQPRSVPKASLTTSQAYVTTQKRDRPPGLHQMWPQHPVSSCEPLVIWAPPQSTPELSSEGSSTCAWAPVCLRSPTPHNNFVSLSKFLLYASWPYELIKTLPTPMLNTVCCNPREVLSRLTQKHEPEL